MCLQIKLFRAFISLHDNQMKSEVCLFLTYQLHQTEYNVVLSKSLTVHLLYNV